MPCPHLKPLEDALKAAGIAETFRGKAWTNAGEWVYFDCRIDREAVRRRLALDPCVEQHEHLGTHDGQEAGFVCTACNTGVMGVHPRYQRPGQPTFP